MTMLENPLRLQEGVHLCPDAPFPSVDAAKPLALLARCPDHRETPLHAASLAPLDKVFIKDERSRMGLGSFKALGAAYVIAHMAVVEQKNLDGVVFATASAGNHGLSVAAGAKIFGARAVIFLAETVPESFAERLRELDATVHRAGKIYEESLAAAMDMTEKEGWILLSDTSWPGYTELPHRLMEGYLVAAAETVAAMNEPPDHIFLQAGVGGMASALAAYFRHAWGDAPKIFVVEPANAPALYESIRAKKLVTASGPESCMGRLDCKEASLIALNGLARDADGFILLSDDEASRMMPHLADADFATTPSGGAGLIAALLGKAEINSGESVLAILSEAP